MKVGNWVTIKKLDPEKYKYKKPISRSLLGWYYTMPELYGVMVQIIRIEKDYIEIIDRNNCNWFIFKDVGNREEKLRRILNKNIQ